MAKTPGVELKQYEIDTAEFANQLGVGVAQLTRRISFELFRRVVSTTPVDTGRLRFGWNMQVGRPDNSVPKPGRYPPPKTPQLTGLDFRRKKGIRAKNELAGQDPIVYITNGVPYMIFIEEGTDRTAPKKIVQTAVSDINARIRALVSRV